MKNVAGAASAINAATSKTRHCGATEVVHAWHTREWKLCMQLYIFFFRLFELHQLIPRGKQGLPEKGLKGGATCDGVKVKEEQRCQRV